MHKDVANSCSSQRRLDEDILRTIDHKLRRKEKIEPKKEEHSKTAVFKNWLASKTLSTYLAETLVTEFSFENDLFRVIDTIKTAVQVLSCSMRKQGFAHMFLLGINKSAKWYGKIAEDGISWNRFYINELVKTEAVCMIAYRGCPKIKRIRGYEQAPYIVVLNVPSYNTIDNCLYGCSWAIYRQPETAALMLLERDAMMEGMKAIAAGYAVFGVSTIFVLSLEKREEVMEFIYDIKTGDFLELGPLTIQGKGQNIVFNESHLEYYDENLQEWILKTKRNLNKPERQMEYHPFFTGNIIVDANRVLQNGGVYLSPRDVDCKEGRLRLMFDCIPLAIIMNKLGGIATDGEEPIIFRKPRHLGEKTAFFFGAKENVEDVLKCIKSNRGSLV